MKDFIRSKRTGFVALGVLALALVSAPSQAADRGGHGFGGGRGGGVAQHEGGHFEGHDRGHFDGHDRGHFEGREDRHFEDHDHFGFGFGFGYPYYPYYPYYSTPYYSTPGYWYYCPSYNGYYPNVTSCPEAWVTVPAQ